MTTNSKTLEVSYETMRQIARVLDRFELTRRNWGRRTAERKHSPRGAGPITTRPLERVEIDHFLVDVHLVVRHAMGLHIQRPWLTAAIDHYSGAIIGYHLTFAPPCASSVLAVLRKSILPKEAADNAGVRSKQREDSDTRPLGDRWPCFGIMDCIVVDNGLDLTSKAVSDACTQIHIEIIYSPPRTPWYKGTIERFGRTINLRLVHWLPGTTLGKPIKDTEYDPKKDACIEVSDFEHLLEAYIVNIHNNTARRGKSGTPLQRWLRGMEEFPPRLPESLDAFDAAIALSESAKLDHTGLLYQGLYYNNVRLGKVWNRLGDKQRIEFRVNPLDLTRIFVLDPTTDEPFAVECTTHFDYPAVLDYHIAIRKYARKSGLDPNNAAHLTQASEEFQRDIAEAVARGKKALRRKIVEYSRYTTPDPDSDRHSDQNYARGTASDDLDDLFSESKRDDL